MPILFVAWVMPHAGCASDRPWSISEANFRKLSIREYTPNYPDESRRHGNAGVAVVSVVLKADGRVSAVSLLEAPDKAIGREVVRTARQWVFQQQVAGTSDRPREGRLTFYFRLVDGRGTVLNPEQMLQATLRSEAR